MNLLCCIPEVASAGVAFHPGRSKAKARLVLAASRKQLRPADSELLSRLTTLHDLKQPYGGELRGELFIHWFYRERKEDRLSKCEIFHLNMLQYFNVMDRVETIHIRCASLCPRPTRAMQQAISILSSGKAQVNFKCVPPKKSWEHDTIKEAAEYAIGTGKFVYYTHFKGVSRISDPLFGYETRRDFGALDVCYWCWLMYRGLFEAPSDVKAIGPMLRGAINDSYVRKHVDVSWSALGSELYDYVGSFQAFSGTALKERCDVMGISSEALRNEKLWIEDPYTVEMFLSLMFPRSDVHTSYIFKPASFYRMYTNSDLQYRKAEFQRLYLPSAPSMVPERIKCEKAVITCLYGSHKLLREPLVVDEGVAYVCVTDDRNFKAPEGSVWQVVYDPLPAFSGRFQWMCAKFRPFRYVDAPMALFIDASIQVASSLLPMFSLPNKGVLLKQHSSVDTIGEELPRWVKHRGMSQSDVEHYTAMLPMLGASLQDRVYGGDVCVWLNTPRARYFGDSILALVEGAGQHHPFMSNQLCTSALAASMFKDIISVLPKELPLRKFLHNTWTEMHGWM